MRLNPWLILAFCFVSCKSQHATNLNEQKTNIYSLESCLPDGNCQLEILRNTSLIVKSDEFNNTYIELTPSKKSVIKYTYKRHVLPNTADAHYEEHLYFEIPKDVTSISLQDKELKNINTIYARLCYCKGTSGYFKVDQGNLEVEKGNNSLKIFAKFKVENIPQLINLIDVEISLK